MPTPGCKEDKEIQSNSAVMYSAIILLWERGTKRFSTGTGILFTDVQASLKS